jgi:hypothetical protein
MLAYSGTKFTDFEDKLLKESVDFIIPNAAYQKHIAEVSPKTPILLYTNTSTLYQDLYTDWLSFADAKGCSREEAFYHAVVPHAYKGDSPSSSPVNHFWRVLRGDKSPANLTSAAHAKAGKFAFPDEGESLYVGHPTRSARSTSPWPRRPGAAGPRCWSTHRPPTATASRRPGRPCRWSRTRRRSSPRAAR